VEAGQGITSAGGAEDATRIDGPAYFFANGNEQRGPYPREQFLALGLRPDTLVWRDGLESWQRLDALPELAGTQPPPQPPAQQPALAVVPAPEPMQPGMPVQLGYHGQGTVPPASGFALAGLILGIVGTLSYCGGLALIGIPCAILAIIFGILGRRQSDQSGAGGRGFATAGLILGCVHLSIVVLIIAALLAIFLIH
jgi:hypothetical protein